MPTDSAPAVAPPPFHADPAVHRALEARLRQTVKGEVQFDPASRALYATDSSNYRQVPIGIVCPRDADDAVAAVAACREFGAPVLSRGAGTSLAGQGCNVAVVLDFSRHCHRILGVDPERRQARVQPGVVLDRLRDEAERVGLTFGPDPATHRWCTLGGMIGNNSCGVHSVMSGKTDDNIDELDILTYDGVRMRVGATPPEMLDGAHPRRRQGGRDLRRPRADTGPVRRSRSRAVPEDPAEGLRVQPRFPPAGERLQCGARAGRFGGHLRHDPRGDGQAGAEPAVPVAARAGVCRHLPRRRRRRRGDGGRPDRARGRRRAAGAAFPQEEPECEGPGPAAGRAGLALCGVRRRHRGRGRGAGPRG